LHKLDLRGLKCPLPVLKTRKFLSSLAPGEKVEVACTDPLSAIDLPNLMRETGDALEASSKSDGALLFLIRKKRGDMSAHALAAVVYGENEPIDALFAELRRIVESLGRRVGGIIQSPCEETIYATHIESGRQIDLMQDLGACAEGCRLDTGALAEAAGLLAESLASPPDLLMISRFGRAEAEGGGFLAEIGAAACAETPTLIGVSAKHEADWRAFAGDFAETLPFSLEAALDWWEQAGQRTQP
jgi:TusA-related sulfurtransferase